MGASAVTKMLACVCVMVSAFVFGMELSKSTKKKLALVDELCKALELMHGELSARPSLMVDLCTVIAVKTSGEVKQFFEYVAESMSSLGEMSFSEIWSKAIGKSFSALDMQQLTTLNSLGTMMGAFQLSEQLDAIKSCKDDLEYGLKNMIEDYQQSRKLYLGIPCSLAAMVLVILI